MLVRLSLACLCAAWILPALLWIDTGLLFVPLVGMPVFFLAGMILSAIAWIQGKETAAAVVLFFIHALCLLAMVWLINMIS